jgi:integrase
MPRKRSAPRLYLDSKRKQWIIRDGQGFRRTGCSENDRSGAEKQLAAYLGAKWKPQNGQGDPLIADVLLAYAKEHVPHTATARDTSYLISDLGEWWEDKHLNAINAQTCRAFARAHRRSWGRRGLEILRASIRHWHREHGPLAVIPSIVLPAKEDPRTRWLTRSEAARLLWAARRTPYLARFILLALYTGSRKSVLFNLQWDWIDFKQGLMRRRAPGTAEKKNKRTPTCRLGSRILTHLRRWKRLDDRRSLYVCHYHGQKIKNFYHSWLTAQCRSGLGRDVTPHTLRHTRATWLMQNGIDVWQAAGHLGMSPAILQGVYGKHHPDYQKEAAEV